MEMKMLHDSEGEIKILRLVPVNKQEMRQFAVLFGGELFDGHKLSEVEIIKEREDNDSLKIVAHYEDKEKNDEH